MQDWFTHRQQMFEGGRGAAAVLVLTVMQSGVCLCVFVSAEVL
jgi:hypothetical protein